VSDVISFLERMGQDANLRHGTRDDIELAMIRTQVDPDLQAAIMNGDQIQIEALLGADHNVCCVLMPKENEEEEPSKDDDEITARSKDLSMAAAA
jgi:hypothetical protein